MLNKTEVKLLNEFFNTLDDYFSNAGCNDFQLPNTPEGREIYIAIEKSIAKQDDGYEPNLSPNKKEQLITMDSEVLSYLRTKLDKILKNKN